MIFSKSRLPHIALFIVLIAIMPVLAGCDNFDPDNLDVFGLGDKDKLPGKRELLFPNGVPGVTQGIPPEYKEGYGAASLDNETLPSSGDKSVAGKASVPASTPVAGSPDHHPRAAHGGPMQIAPVRESNLEKPKPRPAPRRHVVKRKPKTKPKAKPVERASKPAPESKPAQTASQPSGTSAPWPSTPPQQSQSGWPAPNQQKLAPWPSAPPSGSFSK